MTFALSQIMPAQENEKSMPKWEPVSAVCAPRKRVALTVAQF